MSDPYAGRPVQPGDILLVRHGNLRTRAGRAAWFIRLGAWLARQPHTVDHVIIAWKIDDAGTYWGIQGQPGVVSSVDIGPWLTDPHTITNATQPKTATQRAGIVAVAETLYTGRVGYDWAAIIADAAVAASRYVGPLWRAKDEWGGQVPAHVVCSSAADFVYERAGLASPKPDRYCTPGDWQAFIAARTWELAA